MEAHKLKDLLDRYERGECSPEEEDLILQWYQNISAEHERPINEKETERRLWASVKPQRKPALPVYYKIAAAIALFIMIGSGYFFWREWKLQPSDQQQTSSANFNLEHHTNNTASPVDVLLLDGSRVTLQPGGRVSFSPTVFNTDNREVYLSGQAFFDVKRDPSRPFLVHSKDITTRVLGTSFNIKAYDNEREITVTVVTGKVSVFTGVISKNIKPTNTTETILKPNERLVYNTEDRNVLKATIQKPEILLTEPNHFIMKYDGSPVGKIFENLEENYGIEIQYDNSLMKDCIVTTSMTDENFYERIQILCKAVNATYEVVDGAVVISSEGCN